MSDEFKKDYPRVKQESVSNLLRAKQYIIPSKCSIVPYKNYPHLNVPDYPLPPNEEKTEILRIVVRETLSIDMIDRLVSDICHVTESLMNSEVDLGAWQPTTPSIEKQHSSQGLQAKHKHKARRPMDKGVHRSVC